MRQISNMLNGLVRTISLGKEKNKGQQQQAGSREIVLKSSGCLDASASNSFVSVFSQTGQKGVSQDRSIVSQGFGCQDNTIFCGIFDGHGEWGHYVAKSVRKTLPASLLCHWQEAVANESALVASSPTEKEKINQFNVWRQSCLTACETVDKELKRSRSIDTYYSGTTALTMVKQGDLMVISNVGDSRAVLATTADDGSLMPVQLTVDFKPNLPQELERIKQCNGQVYCLDEEPGVHRLWLPGDESPGLAMSRAFGDFCMKGHGLISVPDVTQRIITSQDRFVILATDGVWDVISNEEAIEIVSSTPERHKSAKRLVECAVRAWKRKRRGIAVDDCSAICLFFHSCPQ
ncbi:hypothetical protein LUZ63_008779 [Rhynchospora breviuscula]|uniref:protein-serine/threonine phosphatase n=1 Tax=Rhynchospora breviuscula TaxID=2022672 RepID=A0A9Q0HMV5_9POAL|nr:hypothetical protein LUZ63_008779 [Rhynchospora breviuscula]